MNHPRRFTAGNIRLPCAGAQSTGLQYHPHVGLVRDTGDLFGQKVAALAKTGRWIR